MLNTTAYLEDLTSLVIALSKSVHLSHLSSKPEKCGLFQLIASRLLTCAVPSALALALALAERNSRLALDGARLGDEHLCHEPRLLRVQVPHDVHVAIDELVVVDQLQLVVLRDLEQRQVLDRQVLGRVESLLGDPLVLAGVAVAHG